MKKNESLWWFIFWLIGWTFGLIIGNENNIAIQIGLMFCMFFVLLLAAIINLKLYVNKLKRR